MDKPHISLDLSACKSLKDVIYEINRLPLNDDQKKELKRKFIRGLKNGQKHI